MIVPPYCVRHSQTFSVNASRPIASRLLSMLVEISLGLVALRLLRTLTPPPVTADTE